jgi:hypothetical protein
VVRSASTPPGTKVSDCGRRPAGVRDVQRDLLHPQLGDRRLSDHQERAGSAAEDSRDELLHLCEIHRKPEDVDPGATTKPSDEIPRPIQLTAIERFEPGEHDASFDFLFGAPHLADHLLHALPPRSRGC